MIRIFFRLISVFCVDASIVDAVYSLICRAKERQSVCLLTLLSLCVFLGSSTQMMRNSHHLPKSAEKQSQALNQFSSFCSVFLPWRKCRCFRKNLLRENRMLFVVIKRLFVQFLWHMTERNRASHIYVARSSSLFSIIKIISFYRKLFSSYKYTHTHTLTLFGYFHQTNMNRKSVFTSSGWKYIFFRLNINFPNTLVGFLFTRSFHPFDRSFIGCPFIVIDIYMNWTFFVVLCFTSHISFPLLLCQQF